MKKMNRFRIILSIAALSVAACLSGQQRDSTLTIPVGGAKPDSILAIPNCSDKADSTLTLLNGCENSDSTLTLLFAGDIMGHDGQIAAARDDSTGTYSYDSVFKYISPVI